MSEKQQLRAALSELQKQKNTISSLQGTVNQNAPQFNISSNGLTLTVSSGTIYSPVGSSVQFTGGSVIVPDNSTYEVVLGLQDNILHAFPRAIDSGVVRIATVTTSGGKVTSIKQPSTFTIPNSNIEKFKRKLLSGQSVSIALLGDSLTEGAGSGTMWFNLLFSSTYASSGFNIPNVANVTVDNYAVGGQTSHHAMAVALGKSVKGSSGGYNNTNITQGKVINTMYATTLVNLKDSPLLTQQYDLIIFGMGANGGTYDLPYQETVIRELRQRGSEMIVHTSTWNTTAGLTSLYSEGDKLADIAERNGCAVADFWSYGKEKENNGIPTKADNIHWNAEGHKATANCGYNVINSLKQVKGQEPVLTRRTTVPVTNPIGLKNRFPNICDVVFTPSSTTGTTKGSGVTIAVKNPALAYGGKTTSNDCVELTTGQNAVFAHQGATHIGLLVNGNASFTADIKVQGGTAFGTVSNTGLTFNRIMLIEVMDASTPSNVLNISTYSDISSGNSVLTNRALTINCTSGTMQIIGVVFYTYKYEELTFKDITFVGTWSTEACWGITSYFSDTDGDSFSFAFTGIGCQMLFNSKPTSGKIDVYLDGVQVITGKDLVGAGDYKVPIDIFANTITDDFTTGYGKHVVKVVANGTTGTTSYVAAPTCNHRTQLLNVRVFDAR